MRHQDKRRQNGEHAQHTERNALCQHNTDVRADFKAHKYQYQQPDDRCCRAARYRPEGGAQGVCHCRSAVVGRVQLLPVAVHQNYGIVHRQRKLQHRRNAEADIRNLSEEVIRAEIQHNRNADGDKKQHRLKIRAAGDEQDDKNDAECRKIYRKRNVRRRGVVVLYRDLITGELFSRLLFNVCFLPGVIAVSGVQNVKGIFPAVIIAAVPVIGHAVYILNCGKRVLYLRLFPAVQSFEHYSYRVYGFLLRKLLFHKGNTLPHRGIIRQIFCHVGIYADLRYQKNTDSSQYQHNRKNNDPFVYDKIRKSFHGHTSRVTVDRFLCL